MKRSTLLRSILALPFALLAGNSTAQDLVPGINYSYNPPGANGIITNITVDACENDGVNVGQFDVAMYLYDQSTQNVYIIGTTTVNSLTGSNCITISNWNIDINDTPGIPGGQYRLGIWVDSGEVISESDDNNNAGLLSGNINYSPAGIQSITAPSGETKLGAAFPNPAAAETKFSFTLAKGGKASLKLFDAVGRQVAVLADEELAAGNYEYKYDTALLPEGVYFYTLEAEGRLITRKLMVVR